jgi:NAD(P)H-flavin reductase
MAVKKKSKNKSSVQDPVNKKHAAQTVPLVLSKTELVPHEHHVPQIKTSADITPHDSPAPMLKEKREITSHERHSPMIRKKSDVATHKRHAPVLKEQVKVLAVVNGTMSSSAGRERENVAPPVADSADASVPASRNTRVFLPRHMPDGNPYMPRIATVKEIIQETAAIKTLRVVLDDPAAMSSFSYEPGQVGQLSVFGCGESTFVINSQPSQKEYLQFSVMQTGEVTYAIHRLSVGEKIGLRAPLGNFFPWRDWKGKNIFFVGGGIGIAPIRVIMLHLLEHRSDYGKISLLYGARSPKDMAYSYEVEAWIKKPDLNCTLCIDAPFDGWPYKVGIIPNVLLELHPDPKNCVAIICGPPIMIKFTLQALEKIGFMPENIVTTLEKRMKCGIGICGRCNIGGRYVCVDGPVFTLKQLQELPQEL